MDELELRREMCAVGSRLWERDLIGGTEGNISARLGPNRILCTPSGISKGHMAPGDMIVIDDGGGVSEPNPSGLGPSTEIKLHLRILKLRPDCMAVIHAHPPVATGLTLAGLGIPDDVLPEAIYALGPVALLPFTMPGTDEVPDAIDGIAADHKTFLLSHHGAATMGSDLWDACHRMETLERVAKMVLVATVAGGARRLPETALREMRQALNGLL